MTDDEWVPLVTWVFPVLLAALGVWILGRLGPEHRTSRAFYDSLVPVRARVLQIRKVIGSAPNSTDPEREYHYLLGFYGPDGVGREVWSSEVKSINRLVQGQEVTAWCVAGKPDHVVLRRRSPRRQLFDTAVTAAVGVGLLLVATTILWFAHT